MSKVKEKKKNLGSKIFNLLLWILLLCFLIIPGYLFYISFVNTDDSLPTPSEILEKVSTSSSPEISEDEWEETEEDTNTEEIYDEIPVLGENFFEKFPVINGQQTYIAIPMRVDTENLPPLVIYNHGDGEDVVDSISGDFMLKLREYSETFAANNYIFAASEIHDNGLSTQTSLDINEMIDWIDENYSYSGDIFLIGFSRGGYTTTNYIVDNSEKVKGVALLAPATYYTDWDEEKVEIIMDIPIKIWHGEDDVNIEIVHSENFVNALAEYDKEIVLERKESSAHYDVDDEYIDEILEFLESTQQQ